MRLSVSTCHSFCHEACQEVAHSGTCRGAGALKEMNMRRMRVGRRGKNLRTHLHRANGFLKAWPVERELQWAKKEEKAIGSGKRMSTP